MDAKTEQLAAEWIAKFDAAMEAGDLPEMQRIVEVVQSSPNQPFQRAVLSQLG